MIRSRHLVTLTALALYGASAAAQPTPVRPASSNVPTGPVAPSALRADLDLLRRAITESHSGVYRYRSREQIDAAFAAAARRLTAPMDAFGFFRVVAPVIAAIKDGHTRVSLPQAIDTRFRAGAPLLPLRVHVAGNRLYVRGDLRDGGEGGLPLAGREILSIDGRSARRIVADLTGILEGDGSIPSSRAARLRSLRFNLLYGILYGPTASYRLALRGLPPMRMQGRPYDALTAAWQRLATAESERPPAELSFVDRGTVATLTIRSFGGFADTARTRPLGPFIQESFAEMARRNSRALIIDLRGNGGGEDDLGRILLQHLIDHPFTYYHGLFLNGRDISFAPHVDRWPGPAPEEMVQTDNEGRLRLVRHPNLGQHQPAEHRFGGRIFILMDGGSFSTTAEFLSLAHHYRLATFIGEEAGGGYYGNTSGFVPILTLPNSGLRVAIPLLRYELAVSGFSPADRGVPPDRLVVPEIGDLAAGRDRAMELALSLARAR